jgi:hypothetical protein
MPGMRPRSKPAIVTWTISDGERGTASFHIVAALKWLTTAPSPHASTAAISRMCGAGKGPNR